MVETKIDSTDEGLRPSERMVYDPTVLRSVHANGVAEPGTLAKRFSVNHHLVQSGAKPRFWDYEGSKKVCGPLSKKPFVG